MEWQPIDSAPKDGTEVLLYAPACEFEGKQIPERITLGEWVEPSEVPHLIYRDGYAPEEEWDDFEPFWMSWDGGFLADYLPTHWMPLPGAPK